MSGSRFPTVNNSSEQQQLPEPQQRSSSVVTHVAAARSSLYIRSATYIMGILYCATCSSGSSRTTLVTDTYDMVCTGYYSASTYKRTILDPGRLYVCGSQLPKTMHS